MCTPFNTNNFPVYQLSNNISNIDHNSNQISDLWAEEVVMIL